MNFTEPEFVRFLVVVLAVWLLFRRYPVVNQALLLAASFVFYAFHQWQLVFLLGSYCGVNWYVGLRAAALRESRPRAAWRWTAAGVTLNLLGLAFWKYTPLLVNSLIWLAVRWWPEWRVAGVEQWYLPIGISFYAFTGIAYMVDVYRGQAPVERNPWRFALFVSFFPQLVAGPILRAGEFLPRLQPGEMPRRCEHPAEAALLIGRGFFKKMVLADQIALVIDPFFAHVAGPSTSGIWSLPYVYLYAFQIYFDFSGYTDIARGLGLLFGFRWPENFRRPYLATSVQEFWQRWHLTLSRFLRDYLYIPLGGNRRGKVVMLASLMATMVLGGLWHGASWSFLVWGAFHGSLLVIHRGWQLSAAGRIWAERLEGGSPAFRQLGRWGGVVLTFHLVCLGWCFFRLTTLRTSLACVQKWIRFDPELWSHGFTSPAAVWILLCLYGLLGLLVERIAAESAALEPGNLRSGTARQVLLHGAAWGAATALLLLTFVMSPPDSEAAFIYFRF